MRRHVYYFTYLDLEPEAARAMLRGVAGTWLPEPAAPEWPGAWLVELSAEGALPRPIAHHKVIVELDEVVGDDERLLRPVTWRSASAPGVFPVFDGDIELVPLSSGMCQL